MGRMVGAESRLPQASAAPSQVPHPTTSHARVPLSTAHSAITAAVLACTDPAHTHAGCRQGEGLPFNLQERIRSATSGSSRELVEVDFNAAEGVYVNLAEPAEGDRVRAVPH